MVITRLVVAISKFYLKVRALTPQQKIITNRICLLELVFGSKRRWDAMKDYIGSNRREEQRTQRTRAI
jgi:hypothetical protein